MRCNSDEAIFPIAYTYIYVYIIIYYKQFKRNNLRSSAKIRVLKNFKLEQISIIKIQKSQDEEHPIRL